LQKWKVIPILSGMESNEARELARTLERAEAAPYVTYPSMPWWYPSAVGAWFAGMACVLLVGATSDLRITLALLVLLLVELAFFRWYRRKHGAFPLPFHGNPPAEISRVYREYFAGWAVVAAVVALTVWLAGTWPAVVATFGLVTALFAVHEHRYAAAAAAVKGRLS